MAITYKDAGVDIDEADRATLTAWESELAARHAALAAAGFVMAILCL